MPPWVTAATGPGALGRSVRNARSRAPACHDESPSGGTKPRSRVVRAHKARNASKAASSQGLVVGVGRKVADQIWLGALCILTWVSRSANPAER